MHLFCDVNSLFINCIFGLIWNYLHSITQLLFTTFNAVKNSYILWWIFSLLLVLCLDTKTNNMNVYNVKVNLPKNKIDVKNYLGVSGHLILLIFTQKNWYLAYPIFFTFIFIMIIYLSENKTLNSHIISTTFILLKMLLQRIYIQHKLKSDVWILERSKM